MPKTSYFANGFSPPSLRIHDEKTKNKQTNKKHANSNNLEIK